MALPPRINLVTLGVADVARATEFYRALGWEPSPASQEEITFLQLGPMILGLFGYDALAADAAVPAGAAAAFRGFSLAINFESPEEVDAAMEHADRAGAAVVKWPEKVFWGGYSGYFADPDGNLWELAHNPYWALDEQGQVTLAD